MPAKPALDQLMGAYFHQDWHDEANDEWGVLELFVDGEPAMVPLLADEIDALLRERPSEDELKSYVVDELGGCFLADWNGGTYRGWLTEIAERVRAS